MFIHTARVPFTVITRYLHTIRAKFESQPIAKPRSTARGTSAATAGASTDPQQYHALFKQLLVDVYPLVVQITNGPVAADNNECGRPYSSRSGPIPNGL